MSTSPLSSSAPALPLSMENRLRLNVVKCIRQMAAEYYPKKISPLNEISRLETGIFYANFLIERMTKITQSDQIALKNRERVKKHLNHLNKTGAFFHGAAPPDIFEIPDSKGSPSGKEALWYNVKKGKTPSEAIERILNLKKGERCFLDCVSACQIAFFRALKEELGAKFDVLFGPDAPAPFKVGANVEYSTHPIFLVTSEDVPEKGFKTGDWVFFNNHPDYVLKHWKGVSGAWSTICMNTKKRTFTGFGLDPKGITALDLEGVFFKAYNKTPEPLDDVSQKQFASLSEPTRQCIKSLESDTMTREKFREGYPGMIMVRTFDLKRVKQLKNASVDEGLKLLAIWKKQFEMEGGALHF